MRSKWSSTNAKKMYTEAERSLKVFHPDTRKAIKIIFAVLTENHQKISYHGFHEATHKIVTKELRELGYEVINHKTYAGIDLIKHEVRIV